MSNHETPMRFDDISRLDMPLNQRSPRTRPSPASNFAAGKRRQPSNQPEGKHCTKKPPALASDPGETIKVLSISPNEDDHSALKQIFQRSESFGLNMAIDQSLTLKSGLDAARRNHYPVVVSECDLGTATWKELLPQLSTIARPPLLIVSSRVADEYLWAEALNLGAHDVLAKPFDQEEVVRVVNLAWLRWNSSTCQSAGRQQVAAAAMA